MHGSDFTELELTPESGAELDHFGVSVRIAGETLIVGAPDDSAQASKSGAAYIFARQRGAWVQEAKLMAKNPEPHDRFGISVAIKKDTAVVGAYLAHGSTGNRGSVYVFRRNAATWTEEAELIPSEVEGFTMFGNAVDISNDTLVVGAIQGNHGTGAVYVFEHEGSAWIEKAKLTATDGHFGDALGLSVSIQGDIIVAGASSASCDEGQYCGAAYVFQRHGSTWVEEAKLTAGDRAPTSFFGETVSISGSSIVAGTHLNSNPDGSSGAAYVFERDGATWSERAKLTAADISPGDNFGISASIWGSQIVVGACNSPVNEQRTGAAYVFSLNAAGWSQTHKITASNAQANDSFGCWVATSGSAIAVSSYKRNHFGFESGAAYVFQH